MRTGLRPRHGDIHARIAQLDTMIAANPADYTLYTKRGDLYRQHREWPQALSDFEQAHRLDPRPVEVDLSLGRTWLEAGQPEKALPFLESYSTPTRTIPRPCSSAAGHALAFGERTPAPRRD